MTLALSGVIYNLLGCLTSKNKKVLVNYQYSHLFYPLLLKTRDLVYSLGFCCIVLEVQSSFLDSLPLQSCSNSRLVTGSDPTHC